MAIEPIGIGNMTAFERLPFLKGGVQVHYEGSIDKTGGNADWDWWLYKEGDEWVLLDVDGPGCIYNLVQHRYPTSKEPTFKFYFDGEKKPRFTIKQSEFGKKAPFVEPLSAIYEGPESDGAGPIWVIRSFTPMPFRKSCRVTSSVKLTGNSKKLGHGGWGHIMYHAYATPEGVTTFTGKEDYSPLLTMWNHAGKDPKDTKGSKAVSGSVKIKPGRAATILKRAGKESIASIKIHLNNFRKKQLLNTWIKIYWDGEKTPAVELPFGVFFGNELGLGDVAYLSHGMTAKGDFYNYFPMPYWKSARIEIHNKSKSVTADLSYEIQYKSARAMNYLKGKCGYFRASDYYPTTIVTEGKDTIIGEMKGRGHMVAGQVTGRHHIKEYTSCEGDVHVHVDGIATPQVESDGSESWVCYGWGFPESVEMNPSSGYNGTGWPHCDFSMVRLCTGDWYPFRTGLRFGIQAGEINDWPMKHSGGFFYYGVDEPGMIGTDHLDIGNPESEKTHDYRIEGQRYKRTLTSYYEGDDDDMAVTDTGRAFDKYSEFTVAIDKKNQGVRLRRRSDQKQGRQRAKVYVDNKLVQERSWYVADRNPYKRWLEDEFEIPVSYTSGKGKIRIKLEYVPSGGANAWTEYFYWTYSHMSI